MATFYYSKGMSLYDGLIELYKSMDFQRTDYIFDFKRYRRCRKIKEIISYFRENQIDYINSIKVVDKKIIKMV